MTQITARLTNRRDTSANWTAANPVISAGEIVYTTDIFYSGTDQMKFKVGDGVQTWTQLDYMPIGTGSSLTFSNGLTLTGSNITLGGALTANTSITGAFNLEFTLSALKSHCTIEVDDGKFVQFDGAIGNVGIGRNPISFISGLDIYNGSSSIKILDSGELGIYTLGVTGSRVAIFDASKNLISSNTTLTQLSYLDATSSIQTQINGLVPYTGASSDVDLGAHILNAQAIHVKGTAGNGHIGYKHQTADATAAASESVLFADVNGDIKWKNDNLFYSTFKTSANTADRIYTFPNVTGTVITTGDTGTVTNTMLAGSIAASKLVGTDITTVGTVTTGTWGTGAVIAGATMTLGSDASYDLYYRGATGVLTRLANGTTGKIFKATTNAPPSWGDAPVPDIDITYSGGWHITPTTGVKGTASGYGGNIWWYPYPIGTDRTVTDIGIEVTTGAAASNIRLALYADTGAGRPGALIEESGNISSVGTGLLSYTFASAKNLSASNKFYWLAFQASAAGIAVRYSNIISNVPRSTGGFVGICTLAQAFGAFPASAAGYSENTSGAYLSIQLKVQ